MISFELLGRWGRFGNQLFQYAYLRTMAERLGVQFHCPRWLGDEVFQLDDEDARATEPCGIDKVYVQPRANTGYHPGALEIEDGTDVRGNFQSERYFQRDRVERWYTFKEAVIAPVRQKCRALDLSSRTGLHVRLGDMVDNDKFLLPPLRYYRKAIRILGSTSLAVFSDEPARARHFLRDLSADLDFVFMAGNAVHEDLYLMTRCRHFICSISTLSWWGAWLNHRPEKRVVAPRDWTRPGFPVRSNQLPAPGWTVLRTARPLLDDYRFLRWKSRLVRSRGRPLRENLRRLRDHFAGKRGETGGKRDD